MRIIKTDRFDERAYKNALDLHEELPNLEHEGQEKVDGWADLQNDFFQEYYQANPEAVPRTRLNSLFHDIVQSVRDTQEYRDLRYYTESDVFNSAIATNIIGRRMLPEVTERLASELAKQKQYQDQLDALEAAAEAYARKIQKAGSPDPELLKARDEIEERMQALRQAAEQELPDPGQAFPKELGEALGRLRTAFRQGVEESLPTLSFLCGAGQTYGLGGQGSPLEVKKRVAERVMGSRKLKNLFEMAGRVQNIAMAKDRTKVKARSQQIIGVEVGRDLDRVLPAEMALAAVPQLKPLFFKQYADKALQLYEMEAKRELGGGPIVMLLDGSGSMQGPREIWAKAVMLAFLQLAKRDHRDVYVMQFSYHPGDARTWKFTYRENPDLVDWDLLLDACETFLNGGTNFTYPLTWAADRIEESLRPGAPPAECLWERADIVLITDGEAAVHSDWKKQWQARKDKLRFHTFAVLLGMFKEPESLIGVADRMCVLNDFTKDEEALHMLFASEGVA